MAAERDQMLGAAIPARGPDGNPRIDRALPWPWPLLSATMTVGRQNRSTMRDATMPMTPACHPSAASTRARLRIARPSPWIRSGQGLLENLFFDGLPLAVLRFQINGDLPRLRFARGGEHLHGQRRMAQAGRRRSAAGPGEIRRDSCPDSVRSAPRFDQCANPRQFACCRPPRAEMRQDAILADERHDIGDGSQRRQRRGFDEKFPERFADACRPVDGLPDSPRQLERHARAAQMRIGIRCRVPGRRGWTIAWQSGSSGGSPCHWW